MLKFLFILLPIFNAHALSLENAKVEFVGFKLPAKIGVGGTFKQVEWQFQKNKSTTEDMLLGSTAKIDSYSIDTKLSARNSNIIESLFKKWGGQFIYAKVLDVDKSKKRMSVQLRIGEKVNKTVMVYQVEGRKFQAKGTIDLVKMGLSNAFSSLASKCRVLHTDKDGIAKTWSDVDIKFSADLK